MNIILAEEIRYPIGSFIDEAKKTFPPTSIINCTDNNLPDVQKKVAHAPSLSRGWLIFANLRPKQISEGVIKSLEGEWNVVIYIVRNQDLLREMAVEFEKLNVDFKLVNNLSPDKEKIVNYVLSELNISEKDADYLVRRHREFLPKVAESVNILKSLPKVTKTEIRKYTSKSLDLGFDALFRHIIGQEKAKHNKAVSVVKRYRYGLKFLVTFIVKRFEVYLLVYEYAFRGELSLENHIEFRSEHKDEFKEVGDHIIRYALEAIGLVSYEKLNQLYWMWKKELSEGPTVMGVLSLLRLAKI